MNDVNRVHWVDYLRSAIIILVVALHSAVAYATYGRFDYDVYINSTHPIIDAKKGIGFDLFAEFLDVFIMPLMFLIGGLFLMRSINKKGRVVFIKDRFLRLFVPFLFPGTLFMLIAYFPSYYIARHEINLMAYIKDFFLVQDWPAGPPWFLLELFFFNLIFAIVYPLYQKMKVRFHVLKNKPFIFVIIFFIISWLLYVPLAYKVGTGTWVELGPLEFDLSRVLFYFGYFSLGIFIGNTDFNAELFSRTSAIVKKWWLWAILSFLVFAIYACVSDFLTHGSGGNKFIMFIVWIAYDSLFPLFCTLISVAFITIFRKLLTTSIYWMNSFSDNAYMIFLIHYIFVVWIQFLLLKLNIPAAAKFSLTFILSIILSWGASSLLRKIAIVRRYI
ncbi:MAG: acyltransferase family protein [bacterium]